MTEQRDTEQHDGANDDPKTLDPKDSHSTHTADESDSRESRSGSDSRSAIGGGAATGDLRADRSEEDEERPIAEGIGDDPGAPGGMGGARARPAGIGRPPGGDSPPR